MDIGIDASCWWNRRGFGRFTRELLKAMFAAPNPHRYCLFIDQPPDAAMLAPNVRIVRVDTRRTVTQSAVAADRRGLRDVWAFRRAVAAQRLDLMFFPAVYSWFPVKRGPPCVVTVHDAIAEHFPDLVFPGLKGRLLWALKIRLACRQAARIMTVSQAARAEIVAHLGVAQERIDVVTEAADARFQPVEDARRRAASRRRAKLPDNARLVLYVGGFAPHKNLGNLLRGFALAAAEQAANDIHLALVGDPGGDGFHSNTAQLMAQIDADPALSGRVHFTGFVADDDLVALYTDALAVVMPSFSEGFGLPAVEAMACGTPVLSSTAGAVPEVVGEAGLYFDPNSPQEIAAAIVRLASDNGLNAALREKARARARLYSWQRAAAIALAHLEAVGGRP
ncbi:MAG: glycosyltransferase family 4 protein [Pseudomonadota bacterium]